MSDKSNLVGGISKKTLERLPVYYHYLLEKSKAPTTHISAPVMANDLQLNEVQVRKELAIVSKVAGKPKSGYLIKELLTDFEDFLGYNNVSQAVLIGVGSLGTALLSYKGFATYGVEIVAGFDLQSTLVGSHINHKMILPIEKLGSICQRMNIHIGIITVPAEVAQEICDQLVASGIRAIWNFAPIHLNAPGHVLIQNENMAASLALLSKYLYEAGVLS